MSEPFRIGECEVPRGTRMVVDLPLPRLYTHTPMVMAVHVVRGKRPGPTLFVSAAVHGDELNGVEIIRRLLSSKALRGLRGTLLAVPVVNVFGFLDQSRYLPDRRDLNRSFPGSQKGSMAARMASMFMREIVARSNYGIDLHTGALHRTNLPQIRANLDDAETERVAHAFGVPVLINSTLPDGSLREAAAGIGVPMLLYEAGEALRFDEVAIRAGVKGIINVMRTVGMLPESRRRKPRPEPFVAHSSHWVRAPESGVLRTLMPPGIHVRKGDVLGIISDPFSAKDTPVESPANGLVIGRTHLPLVHEGEATFHIARFEASTRRVARRVEDFQADHEPEPGREDRDLPII